MNAPLNSRPRPSKQAGTGPSPDVDDELVGAGAGGTAEQHGVVLLQALGHVVGVQDGLLGGLRMGAGGTGRHRLALTADGAGAWSPWA